jgi:hypothetical protein
MKALGRSLFGTAATSTRANPVVAFERASAAELKLPESWFRDAIFDDPELVLGPCREAGLVPPDEQWLPWRTEYSFGSGPVDVLLVSSRGRLAIVETKLSYNPGKRREVVAQILDYALSLQDAPLDELPPLPDSEFAPDPADLADCLSTGRFMLIVAGDTLDPRAIKLSQAVLARQLTSEWDLVMVDLNVYRSVQAGDQLLIVPELRGSLVAETRQVVRVQVEGETPRARILVERLPSEEQPSSRRPKLESADELLEKIRQIRPAAESAANKILHRFQEIDRMDDGRLVLGFQSASANLYWKSETGALRRILSVAAKGRLRVWVGYLRAEGRRDLADLIRQRSASLVSIGPNAGSGFVNVDQVDVDAVLRMIDSIVEAFDQAEP